MKGRPLLNYAKIELKMEERKKKSEKKPQQNRE